jgi:hypothetical protein
VTRPAARRLGAVLVLVVTLAAVVLVVAVFAPRWWSGEGGSYAPPVPATAAHIEPSAALFGDVLTARATVLVDSRTIDPDTVRLYGRFAPYRIASTSRSVDENVGQATRVNYVFRLQCLTVPCLGAMEREGRDGRRITTPITFRSAALAAETRDGAQVDGEVRWPSVVVRSRLSADDVASGEPQAPRFRVPETTYRISPDTLAWLLVGATAVLALVGGVLVAGAVRGRVAVPRLRLPAHMSPVERALALARHAAAHSDTAGERRALERLATELRRSGDGELAVAVRQLAWSQREPTGEALDELAAELARMGNGH